MMVKIELYEDEIRAIIAEKYDVKVKDVILKKREAYVGYGPQERKVIVLDAIIDVTEKYKKSEKE